MITGISARLVLDFFTKIKYNKLNIIKLQARVCMKMTKTVTAILVAGGSSSRMGFDKLALPLGQSTVLGQSLAAFEQHPDITEIVLVHGKNIQLARREAEKHSAKPITLVAGGATRAESVANGMQAAKGEIVAIHDAARPFVSQQLITQVLQAACRCCFDGK